MYGGDVQAVRAIKAGAYGYLLKNKIRKELPDAIRAVHAGRKNIPPEIAAEIAEHFDQEGITHREREVLQSVAEGNANKEVAARLRISEETVKAHMKKLLAKLGANDRTHAVMIALRRGVITTTPAHQIDLGNLRKPGGH
jgi:DNA-binding NarL/FixJ family response regulator